MNLAFYKAFIVKCKPRIEKLKYSNCPVCDGEKNTPVESVSSKYNFIAKPRKNLRFFLLDQNVFLTPFNA